MINFEIHLKHFNILHLSKNVLVLVILVNVNVMVSFGLMRIAGETKKEITKFMLKYIIYKISKS